MCEAGLCSCRDGFIGEDCAIKTECTYWDNDAQEYSTSGCVSSPPPGGSPDGFLHCLCTHLTDFSVLRFPSSLADLLAELSAITFNTFSAEDALRFFTSFNAGENPAVTAYVSTILALWFFSLLFARFRRHRRALSKARAGRRARRDKRNALLVKMRQKRLVAAERKSTAFDALSLRHSAPAQHAPLQQRTMPFRQKLRAGDLMAAVADSRRKGKTQEDTSARGMIQSRVSLSWTTLEERAIAEERAKSAVIVQLV